jgi:quercetin dioxygenase-like cupin family protein
MNAAVQARHVLRGDGKTYELGRVSITFKTTAEHNSGAYTLCEAIEPPSSGAGRHRHPTYDETFIICAGRYEFELDQEMLNLSPGDVVFVPRGTPHSFMRIGPEVGRQLIISSPSGIFDAFIAEVATSIVGSDSASRRGPAMEFRAIAAKYGMELLS